MPSNIKHAIAILGSKRHNVVEAAHERQAKKEGFQQVQRKISGRGGSAEKRIKKLTRAACKRSAEIIKAGLVDPNVRDEILGGNIKPKRRTGDTVITTRTPQAELTAQA